MKTEHKITGVVIILTLVIIVGGSLLWGSQTTNDKERLNRPLMGEKMPDMGSMHVKKGQEHPAYNSNPPTSGWHWAGTAGPGIKDEQVADELVLHSMEHGAAVLWYRADLPQSDVEKLKSAFQSATGKKIMIPRESLDVPVALTSWGYLLKLESIDAETIVAFIETNNDRAPEKAPI